MVVILLSGRRALPPHPRKGDRDPGHPHQPRQAERRPRRPYASAERLLQPPLGATLSPEVCGEGELRPAQRRSPRSQAARRPGGVCEGEGTGAFPVAVVTVSPGR